MRRLLVEDLADLWPWQLRLTWPTFDHELRGLKSAFPLVITAPTTSFSASSRRALSANCVNSSGLVLALTLSGRCRSRGRTGGWARRGCRARVQSYRSRRRCRIWPASSRARERLRLGELRLRP